MWDKLFSWHKSVEWGVKVTTLIYVACVTSGAAQLKGKIKLTLAPVAVDPSENWYDGCHQGK